MNRAKLLRAVFRIKSRNVQIGWLNPRNVKRCLTLAGRSEIALNGSHLIPSNPITDA